MVIAHQLEWTCASPLWGPAMSADRTAMRRPTILSFATDAFIDDLNATLARRPADVATKVAVYESERATPAPAPTGAETLKLYQPAHGRHYLVAANLVCQIPGIPDHVVDISRDEAISFVLRRVDDKGGELAWVITRAGQTPEGEWRAVPDPRAPLAGEKLYPMFGLPYADKGRTRKLNIGLVPVGAREQFEAAEIAATPPDTSSEGDPRANVADSRLADTLELLQTPQVALSGVTTTERDQIRAAQEAQEKEATAFLLLDLADWLAQEAPRFWTAIAALSRPSGTVARQLYDALTQLRVDANAAGTWRDGMLLAASERDKLLGDVEGAPTLTRNARRSQLLAQALRTMLNDFVAEIGPAAPAVAVGSSTGTSKSTTAPATTGLRYVLRAIYRRPRCGALHKDVVSDPSAEFVLAAFYDFDAPARPIRISLPIDTSIAGLRKFKKNVSFVLSKSLRAQLSRTTDLKKALDGNIASGKSFELSEICSFSIPVITICALIVLMIFIQLLNIVFWWIPFLKICLPIPQPRSR
jgi:hypothetical protein